RPAHARDAGLAYRRDRGTARRLRHAARQWLHFGSRHLRHRAPVAALDRGDGDVHGDRNARGRRDAPRIVVRSAMPILSALLCGFIFGAGLVISGMTDTTKVLDFLDVLAIPNGGWDPTLAIVMAAALVVSIPGFWFVKRR